MWWMALGCRTIARPACLPTYIRLSALLPAWLPTQLRHLGFALLPRLRLLAVWLASLLSSNHYSPSASPCHLGRSPLLPAYLLGYVWLLWLCFWASPSAPAYRLRPYLASLSLGQHYLPVIIGCHVVRSPSLLPCLLGCGWLICSRIGFRYWASPSPLRFAPLPCLPCCSPM